MEFLKTYQLDIMMFLSGICFILTVLTLLTRSLPRTRRFIIARLEAACMMLLLADRCAYLFRGEPGTAGFYAVRISNFLVYLMTLLIIHQMTLYLFDLFRHEGKYTKFPNKRLWACEALFLIGVSLLIISQFTGIYYTFDASNTYERGRYHVLCYVFPFIITTIQLTLIIQFRKVFSKAITLSLILNTLVPMLAAAVQIKLYGVSLTNMTSVGMAIVLYILVLFDMIADVEYAKKIEVQMYREAKQNEHEMFEQTAEALASAIDAKDRYTHGHSTRVAMYSRKIAEFYGYNPQECEEVYFAALLHDVGKIGVADTIINKDGRLTEDEYAQIKMHPVYGNQILSRIEGLPYLSVGAHFHHERYDGRGYPEGLKGEDIPEIARIIGVADAYDAMTSKRSYRDPIPQQKVREELIEGCGTQFDSRFANIMIHLIDLDTSYKMKERGAESEPTIKDELVVEEHRDNVSRGIHITDHMTSVTFTILPDKEGNTPKPSLILFDSLDGRYHTKEREVKDFVYFEYCEMDFNGVTAVTGARKAQTTGSDAVTEDLEPGQYRIKLVKVKDHVLVKIIEHDRTKEVIIALPDSSRFVYASFTGEHCRIGDMTMKRADRKVGANYIPRIAEFVSYIDVPAGDIPNVQIDGYRTESSESIVIKDNVTIDFHAKSLPTARLVWHCPSCVIFSSADGTIDGENYREFALIRLDGENWKSDTDSICNMVVMHDNFEGWEKWKEFNKAGYDCHIRIELEGNKVVTITENAGISIRNTTEIKTDFDELYVALSGDQCALTNIRIKTDTDKQIS